MHFNWPSVYFTAGAQNLEAQSGAPNSIGAGHNCCKVMRTQQHGECRRLLFAGQIADTSCLQLLKDACKAN